MSGNNVERDLGVIYLVTSSRDRWGEGLNVWVQRRQGPMSYTWLLVVGVGGVGSGGAPRNNVDRSAPMTGQKMSEQVT